MAKKKTGVVAAAQKLRAVRGFDFPLGDALELVKLKGGRSRLTDEERANLRLHRIDAGKVFSPSEYPKELVDAWRKRGLCIPDEEN